MNINEFEDLLISEAVKSTYLLPAPLKEKIKSVIGSSEGLENKVLSRILENIEIAENNKVPVCQDTGVFEIWISIGEDCSIKGVNFNEVVTHAIKKAHEMGGLRKSMSEILPVIHTNFIAGNYIEVVITPRGFGSENYSFLHMMNPESSNEDIANQILKDVKETGGRPCPPYVVGVGIGGTASKAVEMSTLALTEMDFIHNEEEDDLLKKINNIGTGAGAMRGAHTALGIKMKRFPQHIAGLAVGVHIGCWCNRVRRFKFEAS